MSVYSDLILTTSPVAYYRFNESAGTSAADSSGNARTATYAGGVTLSAASLVAQDTANTSADFNGSSGGVNLPASVGAAMNGAAQIVGGCWFNLDALPASFASLMFFEMNSGAGGFSFGITSTGSLAASARSQSADANQATSYAAGIVTGTRYFVACKVDFAADRIYLYLNGALVHTFTAVFGATVWTRGTTTNIDSISLQSGGYVDGRIDETCFWASNVSDATLLNIYRTGMIYTAYPNKATVAITAANPIYSPYRIIVPTASVAISTFAPRPALVMYPPTASVTTATLAPRVTATKTVGNVAAVAITAVGAAWQFSPPDTGAYQTIYRLTLTGSPDYSLPMSSFQLRVRPLDQTSYLSVVVPKTDDYATAIAARPNGTMILEGGYRSPSGVETLNEILRAVLSEIRTDTGANNSSITLTGYRDAVVIPPGGAVQVATRNLEGVSYVAQGPTNQIRGKVNFFVAPGDTAVDPTTGTSLTVSLATFVVGVGRQEMTVSDGVA